MATPTDSQVSCIKFSFDKWRIATSCLAFLFLFPGFFFYHTLLGIGIISAFAGGYFTLIALVFIFPLGFFYLENIKRNNKFLTNTDLYFWVFLVYFFCVISVNYVIGAIEEVVVNHLLAIIHLTDAFLIFKMIDPNQKQFKIASISMLLGMSLIIILFAQDGFFYLKYSGEASDSESIATYQGFARSYLFTFIIVIAFIKSIISRSIIYPLAVTAMYLNGARSEFVATIFLIPIVEIYHAKHKMLIIFGMFVVLAAISLNYETILELIPSNRVLELVDLLQSNSANIRLDYTVQALQTIYENPLFGDYGSYVSLTGVGSYAHNILSVWVDLGLIGFILLLIILCSPACQIFGAVYFFKAESSALLLACILISCTLLLLFTSKNFTDMSIGASLGAYANYRYGSKSSKNNTSYFSSSPQ